MNAMETEDIREVSCVDGARKNAMETEYVGEVSAMGRGEMNAANGGEAGDVDGGEVSGVDIGNAGKIGKKGSRAKHKCPFPSCEASVIHLPRHMRQVHGWNKTDSATVLGTFDLRNPKPGASSAVKKRKHKRKVCPISACGAIVKRIHNHLAQMHKIKRGSNQFVKLAKKAAKYEPPVVDCEMTSSDECSVNSSDEDQSEDLWKVKKRSSSKVYEAVYDSEDSAEYDRILNDIVKGGGKKGGKDVDGRSYDEGKCGDEDIGGDECDGGHSGGSEFDGGDNVGDGEEFDGGDSGDDEFGGGVSGDKGGHGGNEESGTEKVGGDSFDGEGDNDDDGDTATANVSSNVDDKVMLSNFKDWLTGPDGGRKDEKCAQQSMRQVEMVMGYIAPAAPSTSSLLHKSVLRDNWLTTFEKEKKPGTVKSYLGSLNNFYVYLRAECQHKFKELDVSEAQLVSLSEQVKLWAKSFRKMAQDRFWEKRVEDINSLKTPEQIKQFDTSDVARKAVKILGEFQMDPEIPMLSKAEYTIVRDYLMTQICINNGSRSGPIANMTLEEFNKATKEDDCIVVRVKKHKTFTTHGPANIVLYSSLYEYVKIFIEQFRNALPEVLCSPQSTVFLSFTGTELDSSQVGAQIGSCWGKVFGKEASMGGATAFRKAAVSAVHESNEELRGDLADLMVHNQATATKYYLLKNKGKSAVKTSKELSRIMRNVTETEKASSEMEKDEDEDEQLPNKQTLVSGDVICHRHKWSVDEEKALKDVFGSQIKKKEISIDNVRNVAKDHPVLKNIAPSKIRDKVRTYFQNSSSGDSPLPPEEEETPAEKMKRFGVPDATACKEKGSKDREEKPSEDNEDETSGEDNKEEGSQYSCSSSGVVPPSSRSRGGQDRLFTDREMVEFRKLFAPVIHSDKSITTKVAVSMLKENKKLKNLTKKFTNQQIYDKLRTERKIAKRDKNKKK